MAGNVGNMAAVPPSLQVIRNMRSRVAPVGEPQSPVSAASSQQHQLNVRRRREEDGYSDDEENQSEAAPAPHYPQRERRAPPAFVQEPVGQAEEAEEAEEDGGRKRKRDNGPRPIRPSAGLQFVPLEEEDWDNVEQQLKDHERMIKEHNKRRKQKMFSNLPQLTKSIFSNDDEDELDQEEDEDERASQMSMESLPMLRRTAHSGFCFLCRYSQDTYEIESNPYYGRLNMLIEANYGTTTLTELCCLVRNYYNKFLRKDTGYNREWPLHSIAYHIEEVNPLPAVSIGQDIRDVRTIKKILKKSNIRMMDPSTGEETVNLPAVKALQSLLHDEQNLRKQLLDYTRQLKLQ